MQYRKVNTNTNNRETSQLSLATLPRAVDITTPELYYKG